MAKSRNVGKSRGKTTAKTLADGVYRAVVTECAFVSTEDWCAELEWRISITASDGHAVEHAWYEELLSMELFESMQQSFSALDLWLEHFHEIEPLAALAQGRAVYVEVRNERGRARYRMLCPAVDTTEQPPFWRRMTRAQARELLEQRGLGFYADTLEEHKYLREPEPELAAPPLAERPRRAARRS